MVSEPLDQVLFTILFFSFSRQQSSGKLEKYMDVRRREEKIRQRERAIIMATRPHPAKGQVALSVED